jgi:hypothetical protein
MMNIYFAQEALPVGSLFLAGPTPRKHTRLPSWRPEALRILSEIFEFKGDVYVPEPASFKPYDDFDAEVQVAWEWTGISCATVVPFWIPRDLQDMPGFTSNVEFGLLASSGKAILGFPQDAPHTGYLRRLAERFHVPVFTTLYDTLDAAVERASAPFGHNFTLTS